MAPDITASAPRLSVVTRMRKSTLSPGLCSQATKRRAADAAARNAWAAAAAGDSEQPAKKADGGNVDASGKHALATNSVTRLEAPPGGGGGCCCSNGAADAGTADGAGAVAPSITLAVDPSMAPPPPTAAFASSPLAVLAWRADWTLLLVRAFEATTIILVFIFTIRVGDFFCEHASSSCFTHTHIVFPEDFPKAAESQAPYAN